MLNIFGYTDYRDYLRDHYEAKKKIKPYYSYRFISSQVGINPGFIAKLFNGKVQLGLKSAPLFSDLIKIKGKERDYFLELVRFSRAKRDEEIRESFQRLQSIKGVRFKTIADNQTEFFSKWYHMAIRSLLCIHPFDGKNYKKIALSLTPAVTTKEVKDSIDLLKRLKMIRYNEENGVYDVMDTFVSTREKWSSPAITDYQISTLNLSQNAIENLSKSERDISTVTFTCSSKQIETLKQRLSEIRQEFLILSEDSSDEDCVMQLNLQLFPSAKIKKGKS